MKLTITKEELIKKVEIALKNKEWDYINQLANILIELEKEGKEVYEIND